MPPRRGSRNLALGACAGFFAQTNSHTTRTTPPGVSPDGPRAFESGWRGYRRHTKLSVDDSPRRPASLLPCATDTEAQPFGGDRAIHQPAAGLVRRGDAVWVYVHENVPGVIEKSAAVVGAVRRGAPLADALPPSRLVRYDVPVERLERWTREALASLS